jgi:non-specific serine/threonine protein kinase
MSAARTKECPFCAETIKAAARGCRFCGYVFPAGGHGAAAASAALPAPGGRAPAVISEAEVSDLLTGLVEKSLAIYEVDEQGQGRYHLLETVRQYGRDRLLESREIERTRERHREFFVSLAEEAEPQLRGIHQKDWLYRLEREHDNCRAALEWSQHADDGGESALRLAGALTPCWRVVGYYREGRDWLEAALQRQAAAAATERSSLAALHARALISVGSIALLQGDYATAVPALEAGRTGAAEAGDLWQLLNAHAYLAHALAQLGKMDSASCHAMEALAISRQLKDPWATGRAHYCRGLTLLCAGEYRQSVERFEDAVARFRAVGDRWFLAFSLVFMSMSAYHLGIPQSMLAWLDEAQSYFADLGGKFGLAWIAMLRGVYAFDQRDYRLAHTLFEESLRSFREIGEVHGGAYALTCLGHIARRGDDTEAAHAYYRESLELGQDKCNDWGMRWAFYGLASLALAAGEPMRAARLFGAAADLPGSIHPW